MSEHITPERVAANAAAAGIAIDASTAARVANGMSSTAARLRNGKADMPFESEPSTYLVVAHREIKS